MICEIAQVPRKIHETNWRSYVKIRDIKQLVQLLLDPRPVVMVSGHFGNFEVAGFTAGLLGFPTYTVARPLDNPYLDRFLQRFRGATGQYILPKQGSAGRIDAVLAEGKPLAFLGDQHAGQKGCWVEFFGRPASCHKAVAVFSLTSHAPLVVTYARRRDRPLQFEIGVAGIADPDSLDPRDLDVESLTRWYNQRLEHVIRSAPSQYWWLHRRWKQYRDVGRRRRSKPRTAPPRWGIAKDH
jgi:KDO2-lipid IV(A) lauroyltransferase